MDSRALAKTIRLKTLEMTSRGGGSHIGSIFSMADIIAVLYGKVMRLDPANPQWMGRDRFILSKGHAGAAIYVALSERGFFPKDTLDAYYTNGSIMSGHVSHKNVPGVELSTGSLGHGLPVSAGRAYALRQRKSNARMYCVLSDGECDEGSNWEAFLFAGHHKLRNLVAVIDHNKIQSLQSTEETLGLEPFADKLRAFRWDVVEVDGHDHDALAAALDVDPARATAPRAVIAHTIKGKGVSFMEHAVLWHYRTARGEEFERARAEIMAGA
ncbi:MAG: transketolase [Rhodospirillales bacterium]|nr:transketolase [Alphaproteobacteria bacterium]MCB9986255.1 transketolase [Rhodospirillales bacterium]USO07190.1 MAG: transketolase [Rhodospirillales bacterium]